MYAELLLQNIKLCILMSIWKKKLKMASAYNAKEQCVKDFKSLLNFVVNSPGLYVWGKTSSCPVPMLEPLNTNKCVWTAKKHSLTFYMNILPPDPTLFYVCGLWVTITSLTPSSWLYNNNLQCAEVATSNLSHQGEKKLDFRTRLMYSKVKKGGGHLKVKTSMREQSS